MAWSEDMIQKVWEKATRVTNNDPNIFRKDQCGAWINRSQYGNRDAKYGWEIDHITTVSDQGGDELSNLRPLHWENNCRKQDNRLTTFVTSKGNENIRVK